MKCDYKTFKTVVIICLFTKGLIGQDLSPVSWHISTQKTGLDKYTVQFDALVDDDWVIYSINSPEGGPIPTSFHFDENELINLSEETIETLEPVVAYEELFGVDVLKHINKAQFEQVIFSTTEDQIVKGSVMYMACNGRQCLPPTTIPFVALLN